MEGSRGSKSSRAGLLKCTHCAKRARSPRDPLVPSSKPMIPASSRVCPHLMRSVTYSSGLSHQDPRGVCPPCAPVSSNDHYYATSSQLSNLLKHYQAFMIKCNLLDFESDFQSDCRGRGRGGNSRQSKSCAAAMFYAGAWQNNSRPFAMTSIRRRSTSARWAKS